MNLRFASQSISLKEVLFQVILNSIVFVFYAFDRHIPGFEAHQIFFYLNYAIAGLIINYFLLPNYLYKNRYWAFGVYFLIVVGLVIFIEEAFLEQLFYPDTRGKNFLGVFYNLLSTLPTITILVGFKFAWDALTKQREVQELKNSVKESELQYLKSQINPHFLFNNINNLYAYAVEKSPRTPEIILELSDVLRYMLYECKAAYVPLKKELTHLENYIKLSTLQIEGRGTVDTRIQATSQSYRIAPLILSVFVENAFKHSGASQSGDIEIMVEAQVTEDHTLQFLCKNTYLQESNTQQLEKGIGLENVKKRLQLLYPEAHQLHIAKTESWYEVSLTLHLGKTQEE